MRPYHIVNTVFLIVLCSVDILYFFNWLDWMWIIVVLFAYLSVMVLGTIFIRWNFFIRSLHNAKDTRYIALTFDDGPAAETATILDILKEQDVAATFFVIGKNAAAKPELLSRINREGHLIGNHSYSHSLHFDWLPARKMIKELEQTNEAILNITGKEPLLFRPPYGVTNPNLAKAVKQTGMRSIGWSIRSFDTRARDPEALLNRILTDIKGGDIILLHDTMGITRSILTELIIKAREKGYIFARVDKLFDIDAYA